MKHAIVLLAALALTLQAATSQDSTISQNKFEVFSSQTGVLFKTVEDQIDKVKDLNLFVITRTNMETGQTLKALHMTKSASTFFGGGVVQSFTIDWDEIKGFNTALKIIKTQIDAGKPKMETDFSYTTINGGAISAFYFKGVYGSSWRVTIFKKYKYSRDVITGSSFELKNKNIDELVEAIDEITK